MINIKKVVIAAAGQGTRMLDLSKDKSKHLIEVNGRPFLFYLLDNLFKAGYKEIILVGGFKGELMEHFKEQFVRAYIAPVVGDFRIEFINQYEILGPKEKEYGTACPLKCVKDSINEPFIFLYGDNLYSVADLLAMNIDDGYNYVAGLEHDHPEKFGVLITEGEFLKEIVEKPQQFVGNLINTGPFTFTPEVFKKLAVLKKSVRGEYEITDVISMLAKEGKVKVKKIKDFWMDFGNPEDVKKLSDFIKNGSYKTVTEKPQ
jgi:UDP-N-acetylglucosamine diphosphorylase / glucose-1-phosphate thymidylyltransferase / UDP-N-acetylgalactosamine diphosphorylase / glucosamine-1-phosphate N-acetyltransferase / galactosamine-1-phosphate N-acetyltransferase